MATDNFTNTNGTALTTHNSAWVYSNISGLSNSGRIYNNGVSYSLWSEGSYYRSDSTSNESQIILLSGESANYSKVRPSVRITSGNSGYSFNLAGSGTNWDTLNIYKNGLWQDWQTSLSYGKSSNHTLKIVASGSSSPVTINCYVNESLVKTWQDSSSPYTSGAPGIYLLGGESNNYAFGDDWTDNASAATSVPVFMNQYRQRR